MTNIVQFKRLTTAPVQNNQPAINYITFVGASLLVAESLDAFMEGWAIKNPNDSVVIENLAKHIRGVRDYAKTHEELEPLFAEIEKSKTNAQ